MPPFPRKQASLPSRNATDLRGASRLTIDAITGATDLVEAVHANIIGLPGILGTSTTTSTRGIPGTVYRSVRGVARLVGSGIDLALAEFAPLLDRAVPIPQREAVLAALNGVLGDHLAATGNPLAITMRLR
ncbi:MAG: alpha/beta hydrolase, partial [Luteimonas sp.]|nr:alpha/beta hydrolase [Luteimonas sp.]